MSNQVTMNSVQPPGGSNSGQSTESDLFDEFHRSFVDLFGPLRFIHENTPNPNIETHRVAAEHLVPKFADNARALELYFVRWKSVFSYLDPNEMIKEEIANMEAELRRKEAMINGFYEKLYKWKSLFHQESLETPGPPEQMHPDPSRP